MAVAAITFWYATLVMRVEESTEASHAAGYNDPAFYVNTSNCC